MNAATTRTTHAAMLRNEALAGLEADLADLRGFRSLGIDTSGLWTTAVRIAANRITKADNFENAGTTDLLDERREIWRG